ncbi:tRNA (adenosine(37)-N6)-threonylcarbamoyltransferase complex ATPase subunit type 1 TsaE [Coraliomargarita algicola]|uniref:tRNA threonylcarbamoyladenosine biosynthesis protein TsaE n=1 Tax=Coraliomargarita algicola TaxID=3092156 RepID=A0ABZ0RI46_9BACT|nr:tRNA (adenosine(37)-N6)-threonylcarbamoyltransferase complex ATPase subunit type 1 TsaE [Coraliomargarita sp. J2-16]WPJ94675.1 tRNA (adenosine(37)-N6)-threonylcarbamoyltransferase complex ATPase subunit type 1 TsaE [Coraliomargarita sp. J2-16]
MIDILQQLRHGICSHTAAETEALAGQLAALLPADSVLALHGDLGAGKTTFVRGLARAWGIQEAVTSPTYNLYTIYQGERQLIHLDAYRLNSGAELDALMIEDFLKAPWCFAVEWPERIPDALPEDTWHLYLTINSDQSHQIRMASQASS